MGGSSIFCCASPLATGTSASPHHLPPIPPLGLPFVASTVSPSWASNFDGTVPSQLPSCASSRYLVRCYSRNRISMRCRALPVGSPRVSPQGRFTNRPLLPRIEGQVVEPGQCGDGAAERCRGFGGVPHPPNLPPRLGGHGLNQDNAVTVQRNAAGGLGVSPILLIFPREWGLGG